MSGPLLLALASLVGVLVAVGVIEWTRRWEAPPTVGQGLTPVVGRPATCKCEHVTERGER